MEECCCEPCPYCSPACPDGCIAANPVYLTVAGFGGPIAYLNGVWSLRRFLGLDNTPHYSSDIQFFGAAEFSFGLNCPVNGVPNTIWPPSNYAGLTIGSPWFLLIYGTFPHLIGANAVGAGVVGGWAPYPPGVISMSNQFTLLPGRTYSCNPVDIRFPILYGMSAAFTASPIPGTSAFVTQ